MVVSVSVTSKAAAKKRQRRNARNPHGFSLRINRSKILVVHIVQNRRPSNLLVGIIRKSRKLSRGKFRWSLPRYRRVTEESEGLKEDDIVIALVGLTGSGKSTFIRSASESDAPHVGDALGSCTNEIVPTRLRDPERVVLLDTPGFDGNFQSGHNLDILNKIFRWLKSSYKKSKHLSGILYFHRITDNRTPGTLLQYFRMFQKLLGEGGLGGVHLITTMWDVVGTGIGEERLRELRENDWKVIIGQGVRMARCGGDNDTAKSIIRQIIDKSLVATGKDNSGMDDTVIAATSVTGSDESTFIRPASGSETPQVSDALSAASINKVVAVKCKEQQRGRCVVPLDTPGFDSSGYKPTTERNVFKLISEWLGSGSSYTKRLSEILYLHRITDNRLAGIDNPSKDLPRKIFGEEGDVVGSSADTY